MLDFIISCAVIYKFGDQSAWCGPIFVKEKLFICTCTENIEVFRLIQLLISRELGFRWNRKLVLFTLNL